MIRVSLFFEQNLYTKHANRIKWKTHKHNQKQREKNGKQMITTVY